MVGIVLVSHSRALAEALVTLVHQMVGEVPLATSAGVGENRQELGTDALQVAEAIQAVDSPEGVLALVDLGSALLSAEMALELIPVETRSRVRICPAPLVEGAFAAAVQSALGSDLETVCHAARKALEPKEAQLKERAVSPVDIPRDFTAGEPSATGLVQEIQLTLDNPHGLHARPAARFVHAAARFNARIQVRDLSNGHGPVPGNSLNALATLGAVQGHRLAITASGPEAVQALAALEGLVRSQFGDQPVEAGQVQPAGYSPPALAETLPAIPVSEGIVVGPLLHYQPPPPLVPTHLSEDPKTEWAQLEAARGKARAAIQARRKEVAARLGEDQAAIFEAHLLILDDPLLLEETRRQIWTDQRNAAAAWHAGITALARQYASLEDDYLKGRSSDLLDVGNQVLQALAGGPASEPLSLNEPAILLAEELTPNQVAQLDLEQALGLITLVGGPTSHAAVLARSLGLPAVTGAPASLLRLPDGTPVGLDGSNGTIWVQPSDEAQAELNRQREAWLANLERSLASSHQPAVTRDGRAVEVVANAGSLQDAKAALQNGAEGIGVLRTEFLFLNRSAPPGEEEQVAVYRQIGAELQGGPVIVRTLDAGGDKVLGYIQQTLEANPYLGVRGLRLSLQQPGLFSTQLRAILRAGEAYPLRILFPMVTDLNELLQARELVERAHQDLLAEKQLHRWPVQVGIMVEVPAAALIAPIFAPYTDFFSIGTNDLTQYTLAAERGNSQLLNFADSLHPAVLNLVQQVVQAGHAQGKWVGVCGEIAGDPVATQVLVGLGVDELSLNPAGIPRVKAVIRETHYSEAQDLAERLLAARDASEARKLAKGFKRE